MKDLLWPNGPSIAKIQDEIAGKWISEQHHEQLPVRILNYTHKTQWDHRWNAETMVCRGLIVDDNWNVVQRPFGKFFNLGEYKGELPNEPFEVFEKLDGSLGILYFDHNDQPAIATRGSFYSAQAQRATQILREKYGNLSWNRDWTYLFEIVIPENRIVVDYGDTEDLYLLAIIHTKSGGEDRETLSLASDVIPVCPSISTAEDLIELSLHDRPNHEGYVIRFQSGLRLKVKHEQYVRLHRLVTGVTPKRVWEYLRDGKPIRKLTAGAPEKYTAWINSIARDLEERYAEIVNGAARDIEKAPKTTKRRVLAEYIKGTTYPSVAFAILDNKTVSQVVWKMLKPANNRVFKVEV